MSDLITVPQVDIVATGTWDLSSGETTFTRDDLASAVAASQCPAVGKPIIKIGHVDPRFDGEPAVGQVANMALTAGGNKITGDLANLPSWLGSSMKAAYPSRSIEGAYDFVCQIGHKHPFVITALALLGVTAPGVGVLNGLDSVRELFQAASTNHARTWTLSLGGPMTSVLAAGVTIEDVRRRFYEQADGDYSTWITEMRADPLELIVANESNKVFRVPFTIAEDGTVEFGEAIPVTVSYVDESDAVQPAASFGSREDSTAGLMAAWDAAAALRAMGDSPSPGAIKAMFAIPGDTKSASKLPHHSCSGGKVGAANPDACSAAIGALNGSRSAMTGVSAAQKRSAYNHLAAHLRSAGREPPEFSGSKTTTGAGRDHPPFKGSHTHNHSADGSQGGDETHEHAHSHSGDASHAHAHEPAGSSGEREVRDMFTDDSKIAELREVLGLGDDDEVTEESVLAAFTETKKRADSKVAAAKKLPDGVITIAKEAWESLNAKVEASERRHQAQLRGERDTVIAQAIRDGKFPRASQGKWQRIWDRDPDGTRDVIAGLTKNVVPVEDIGSPGGSADELLDEEYRALFPPGSTMNPVQS